VLLATTSRQSSLGASYPCTWGWIRSSFGRNIVVASFLKPDIWRIRPSREDAAIWRDTVLFARLKRKEIDRDTSEAFLSSVFKSGWWWPVRIFGLHRRSPKLWLRTQSFNQDCHAVLQLEQRAWWTESFEDDLIIVILFEDTLDRSRVSSSRRTSYLRRVGWPSDEHIKPGYLHELERYEQKRCV